MIAACAAILPIAGAFQIFDGTQVVGCGVLRGMGRTRPAMVFNLVSYWVLGLPIGSWLALAAAGASRASGGGSRSGSGSSQSRSCSGSARAGPAADRAALWVERRA